MCRGAGWGSWRGVAEGRIAVVWPCAERVGWWLGEAVCEFCGCWSWVGGTPGGTWTEVVEGNLGTLGLRRVGGMMHWMRGSGEG